MLEPDQYKICRLIEEEIIEEFLALGNYSDVRTVYITFPESLRDSGEMLESVAVSVTSRLFEYPFDIKYGLFKVLPKDEYFFKFASDNHYNEFQRKIPQVKIKIEEEDTFWNF